MSDILNFSFGANSDDSFTEEEYKEMYKIFEKEIGEDTKRKLKINDIKKDKISDNILNAKILTEYEIDKLNEEKTTECINYRIKINTNKLEINKENELYNKIKNLFKLTEEFDLINLINSFELNEPKINFQDINNNTIKDINEYTSTLLKIRKFLFLNYDIISNDFIKDDRFYIEENSFKMNQNNINDMNIFDEHKSKLDGMKKAVKQYLYIKEIKDNILKFFNDNNEKENYLNEYIKEIRGIGEDKRKVKAVNEYELFYNDNIRINKDITLNNAKKLFDNCLDIKTVELYKTKKKRLIVMDQFRKLQSNNKIGIDNKDYLNYDKKGEINDINLNIDKSLDNIKENKREAVLIFKKARILEIKSG